MLVTAHIALAQSGTSTLAAGAKLTEGQRIYSPNKSHYLVMQTDGNLCIYTSSDRFVWCNMATKGSGCHLIMQADGNLVVYDRNNQACWSSETHPYYDSKYQSNDWKPVRSALEDDGTLCLYTASNKKVWNSTAGKLTNEGAAGSGSLEMGCAGSKTGAKVKFLSKQGQTIKLQVDWNESATFVGKTNLAITNGVCETCPTLGGSSANPRTATYVIKQTDATKPVTVKWGGNAGNIKFCGADRSIVIPN